MPPIAETEKNRDGSGRFLAHYQTDAFVQAVEEHGPAVGTQEIADEIGCTRDTAYGRLMDLADDGVVETRKVGFSRLWSVSKTNKETADKEI